MSSILKALRKLEEERANRRESSLDIARDILRRPLTRRHRRPMAAIVLGAAGILLALGSGWGWFLLHQPQVLETEVARVDSLPAPESEPPSPPVVAPEPVGRLSAVSADSRVVEEVISNSAIPAVDGRTPPAETADPTSRAASAPIVEERTSTAPAPTFEGAAPSEPLTNPEPTPAAKVMPAVSSGLRVSGIAFQEDPDSRLAIVNDLPVMRGTMIEDALVEEIFSDRVRFTREGQTFDIPLPR